MKLADWIGRTPLRVGFGTRGAGLAGQSQEGQSTQFESRAVVAITPIIDPKVLYLRTLGYGAPGDGGGALYRRVVVEPGHNGKVQSPDGAWWELVQEQETTIDMFGGLTSSTDCTAAIDDYIAFHGDRDNGTANTRSMSGAFPIRFADPQGTYRIASKITVPEDKNCYFFSPVPGGVRLKYTGPNPVMVLFEPKSSGASIGADGMVFEGGDVVVVGATNGQGMFTDCIFSHAGKGLWFCDSFQFHDDDYPAWDITGIAADAPLRLTVPGHGLADNDRAALIECEGEERINSEYDYASLHGRCHVKVIDASTVELYEDAGLTTGYDASGLATGAFTAGKITRGHTGRTPGSSDRNTVHFDVERCSFIACGHGLVFETSTYALFTARKLRFNFCTKTPLVVDASGLRFDDLEFIGVGDRANECYIHIRARHNPASEIVFGHIRTGPEEASATGMDFATGQSFFPPDRLVIIGPRDGTPAKKNAARIVFQTGAFYGDNTTAKETRYAIDANTRLDNCFLGGIAFRNITDNVIKETATAAGRTPGNGNAIGPASYVETTAPAWFSDAGTGWINLAAEAMPVRGGQPVITPNASGIDTAGGGTIAALAAADNESLFQVSITTGAAPAGTAIATVTLPRARANSVRPFIQPANVSAVGEIWYPTSPNASGFTLRSSSSLAAGTNYKLNIRIEAVG